MAGFGKWLRDRRNEGTVDMIARSADPTRTLARLGNLVDDVVITGLLDRSEHALESERPQDALRYADLAVAASLMGGTATTRAEALACRAALLIHQERPLPLGLTRRRLPEQAATDLRAAITIHSRSSHPDAWAHLTELYWVLPRHDAEPLSPDLAKALDPLLARTVDDRARAELRHVLGDIHKHRDARDAVVTAWSSAAETFRLVGNADEEFMVRGKLFQYIALRDLDDNAIELGRACLACAPPDVDPDALANVYHLLATLLGHHEVDEAITAYARAVELLSEKPGTIVHGIQFESAMLMVTHHRYPEAIPQLKAALEGSGGPHVWWAVHMELADLLAEHAGDLGGAIEHVERALHLAISMTKAPALRVHSLHRSGLLHLSANDFETAHHRFTTALPLLEERSLPITIPVTHLYHHLIMPAPRTELFRLAALTSRLTGRNNETATLHARAAELAHEPPPRVTDLDDFDDADLAAATMPVSAEHLAVASVLLHHAPDLALTRLNQIPAANPDPLLATRKAAFTAMCHQRLGDKPAAMAAYRAVLAVAAPGASAELVQLAHWQLATFLMADREYEQAYPHLHACTQLIENNRASFAGVEQRMGFLAEHVLAVYERLVETCLRTGRRVEAYETVQRIKSRSLLDLVTAEHRPIDHTLENRAAGIQADREDWVATYIGGTGPEGPAEDYPTSMAALMLSTSITLHRTMKDIENERQTAGLFDRLHTEGRPFTHAEIRALLREH